MSDDYDEEKSHYVPFLAVGNSELGGPLGDIIICDECGQSHRVEHSEPKGEDSWGTLQFVKCGDSSFLCGIHNKRISYGKRRTAEQERDKEK